MTGIWYLTVVRIIFAVAKKMHFSYTMQVVLKTLVQNLPMCTHVHGHDTVFDVESCIAQVARMLNITCSDQVNVSVTVPCTVDNYFYVPVV